MWENNSINGILLEIVVQEHAEPWKFEQMLCCMQKRRYNEMTKDPGARLHYLILAAYGRFLWIPE